MLPSATHGSPKEFDVAIGYPCASLTVARMEVLDSGATRSHLSLVACDFQPDLAGEKLQRREKQLDGRELPAMTPSSRKKALQSRSPAYLDSATRMASTMHWMDQRVLLLDSSMTGDLRVADQQIRIATIARAATSRLESQR